METLVKKNFPYLVMLIVVFGGVIYFGVKYLKPKNTDNQVASQNQNGGFRQGGGTGRENFTPPITGTVSSISNQTIVMKESDGTIKNITCDSSTRISKEDNGQRATLAISDIKTGDTINVMSSDTSGANITAKMIFVGTMSFPTRGNGTDNFGSGTFDPSSSNTSVTPMSI